VKYGGQTKRSISVLSIPLKNKESATNFSHGGSANSFTANQTTYQSQSNSGTFKGGDGISYRTHRRVRIFRSYMYLPFFPHTKTGGYYSTNNMPFWKGDQDGKINTTTLANLHRGYIYCKKYVHT
jgi:hypothetical protein